MKNTSFLNEVYDKFFRGSLGRGLLIILSLFSIPLYASGEVIERIVAVVNDEIITLTELKTASSILLEELGSNALEGKERIVIESKVLDQLIEGKLIQQAAERMGIVATEREVDNAIEDIKKRNNINQEALLKVLSDSRIDYSDYRKKIKQDITQGKFLERVIRSKITIGEDELVDFYKKNKELFTLSSEVRIRQIFLPFSVDGIEVEREELIAEGREILKRLRRGEDFSFLASLFSKGPSAADGGDLGYIKKDEIDPILGEVAFQLEEGEFSDLIESSKGFHILQVIDRKGGEVRPFLDVKDKVKALLFKKKAEEYYKQWIEDIKKRSYIDVRL